MGWGDDVNNWCYRHPWGWALVTFAMAFFIGIQTGQVVIFGAFGVVMFFVTGWSWSRGWGRKRHEKRHPPTSN
jgi:cell division protein FtsW (lipid II flippase)